MTTAAFRVSYALVVLAGSGLSDTAVSRADEPEPSISFESIRNSTSVSAAALSRDTKCMALARGRVVEFYNWGEDEPYLKMPPQQLRANYAGSGFPFPGALSGGEEWIRGLEYSADGQFLFGIRGDGMVLQWDAKTGTVLRELWCHQSRGHALALSRDGTMLATCGQGPSLIVGPVDGREKPTRIAARDWSMLVEFSGDGGFVATGNTSGSAITVYELPAGRLVRRVEPALALNQIWFRPGRAEIAFSEYGYLPKADRIRPRRQASRIGVFSFAPDALQQEPTYRNLEAIDGSPIPIHFSRAQNGVFAAANKDGVLTLIDLESLSTIKSYNSGSRNAHTLVLDDKCENLLVSQRVGFLRVPIK